MKTYLQLVNEAIDESGVDLQRIDPSDWDNLTGKRMQQRFKKWVKDAWRDVQAEREEWEFMAGHYTGTIAPRIFVTEGARTGGQPVPGAVFVGQQSGYTITLTAVTTISGDWEDGDAVAILEFEDPRNAGDGIFNEVFEEADDDGQFVYNYWGRYDFVGLISDLAEVDVRSMKIVQPNGGGVNVQFIPWATWQQMYEAPNRVRMTPNSFTVTPTGDLDFYPRPDKPYTIVFTYNRRPQELEEADDVLRGIDPRFQDIVVWRAVMYYANYDQNPGQFAYARNRMLFYKNRMERTMMPQVGFAPSRFG